MSGFYASQWIAQVTDRATRYVGDLNTLIGVDEYSSNSLDSTYVTASGTVTYDSGLSGGIAHLRSGGLALANGNAETFNEGGGHLIGNQTDESWFIHSRCKFNGTLTALDSAHPIGIQDNAAGAFNNDYLGFGWNGALEPTYLSLAMQLNVAGAGPSALYVSPKAPDFANWHDYAVVRIKNTATGVDKLICLIDDDEVISVDGPFAALTTNPCFRYTWAFNASSLTPNNVSMYSDNTCVLVKGVT